MHYMTAGLLPAEKLKETMHPKKDILTPAWYVLHTKSRFENVVDEGLRKKAIDVFLPKVTVQSRRKDRKKMIRVPLFPGYVFVQSDLNPNQHLDILKTVGAVRLIGDHQGPISVLDQTIESLKIMTNTRDIRGNFHLIRQPDSGHFSESRVRFFGSCCINSRAHSSPLGTPGKRRALCLVDGLLSTSFY